MCDRGFNNCVTIYFWPDRIKKYHGARRNNIISNAISVRTSRSLGLSIRNKPNAPHEYNDVTS